MADRDTTEADSRPLRPSWEAAPAARPTLPPAPAALPPVMPRPASLAPPPSVAPRPHAAPPALAPETATPSVRYDLAGNPITPAAPPAPFGYSAGPAPAGVWPPPVGGPGRQFAENGTDRVARLRWNWGAFLIPFWWSIFNGQKGVAWAIFLINGLNRVVPAPYDWGLTIASIGIMFYLGVMGNRLAWSSDRFGGDYDGFIRTQRAWMIWGFVLMGLIAGAVFAAAVLLPGFFAAFSGTPRVYPHAYGGSPGGFSGSGQ